MSKSPTSSSWSIKFVTKDQIRRSSIQTLEFSAVKSLAQELFLDTKTQSTVPQENFIFSYTDDEGDKVVIQSQSEFEEAVLIQQEMTQSNRKILKLYLEIVTPPVNPVKNHPKPHQSPSKSNVTQNQNQTWQPQIQFQNIPHPPVQSAQSQQSFYANHPHPIFQPLLQHLPPNFIHSFNSPSTGHPHHHPEYKIPISSKSMDENDNSTDFQETQHTCKAFFKNLLLHGISKIPPDLIALFREMLARPKPCDPSKSVITPHDKERLKELASQLGLDGDFWMGLFGEKLDSVTYDVLHSAGQSFFSCLNNDFVSSSEFPHKFAQASPHFIPNGIPIFSHGPPHSPHRGPHGFHRTHGTHGPHIPWSFQHFKAPTHPIACTTPNHPFKHPVSPEKNAETSKETSKETSDEKVDGQTSTPHSSNNPDSHTTCHQNKRMHFDNFWGRPFSNSNQNTCEKNSFFGCKRKNRFDGIRKPHKQILQKLPLKSRYIKDISVFDGTVFDPDHPTQFTKIWRIENSGLHPWPPGTRLVQVSGDKLTNESTSFSAPFQEPVEPGQQVDVSIDLLSPSAPGRYISYYRLQSETRFGQRFWVDIVVKEMTSVTENSTSLLDIPDLPQIHVPLDASLNQSAATALDSNSNVDQHPDCDQLLSAFESTDTVGDTDPSLTQNSEILEACEASKSPDISKISENSE